jgi:hypothetical protein
MRSLRAVGALVGSMAVSTAVVAGCGGSGGGSAAPSASATSPTTSAPTSAPTSAGTTTTPARPTTQARTAAELKKALLALGDLPPGFSVEPAGSDDGAVDLTSKDPKCAPLVRLLNADTAPGSKASAVRSFSGGQEGPFIDEGLDAMGSEAAVARLQSSMRAAVAACSKVTLSIPGQGRSTVAVRQVSAPKSGTGPFAVRLTATSGPLEGLEVSMVTTGLDDVVLSMTFVAAVPDDVAGATKDAVDKATSVLGTSSGT